MSLARRKSAIAAAAAGIAALALAAVAIAQHATIAQLTDDARDARNHAAQAAADRATSFAAQRASLVEHQGLAQSAASHLAAARAARIAAEQRRDRAAGRLDAAHQANIAARSAPVAIPAALAYDEDDAPDLARSKHAAAALLVEAHELRLAAARYDAAIARISIQLWTIANRTRLDDQLAQAEHRATDHIRSAALALAENAAQTRAAIPSTSR